MHQPAVISDAGSELELLTIDGDVLLFDPDSVAGLLDHRVPLAYLLGPK
jgi:hypothetical protein